MTQVTLNVVDEEMIQKIGKAPFVLIVEPLNRRAGLGSHTHTRPPRITNPTSTRLAASTSKTRLPLLSALCQCSHVQAMRSALILDGAVPS